MAILKGPLLDPDGTDNTTDPAVPAFNGYGYNDGVIDNERHGLSSSMYFLRSGPAEMSDPAQPFHYYNHLRSLWKDNMMFMYGGDGYSTGPNDIPARFAFPSDTDPLALGTAGIPQAPWSPQVDLGAGHVDPRAVASMGPIVLEPGERITLLVAYVYASAGSGGAAGSVVALQERVDSIRTMAMDIPGMFSLDEANALGCSDLLASVDELHTRRTALVMYPNPVSDRLTIATGSLPAGSPIHVLDAQGRTVARISSTGELSHVNVNDLPAGLYTILVSDGSALTTGRFIKE
jgi:hypothetical protein